MIRLEHLRREARDLLECVLLPGLAAFMPWPWCFRVFRVLARLDGLYRENCTASLTQAMHHGWVTEDGRPAWSRACRLVALVDHADFYLAISRSDAWMARHLRVSGTWPTGEGAAILCTFHWGAGMWGLRHAGASGLAPHALVAPLQSAQFPTRRVLYHYYRLRNRAVSRALGSAPIDASASLRPVLKALKAGEQVMAAIDVPADQVSASESIAFLGRRARVPRGLLRLAVNAGVPVTVYLTGIDLQTGARTLAIHRMAPARCVEDLIREVFAHLEHAIRDTPAAWHFWAVAERFFEPDAPRHG